MKYFFVLLVVILVANMASASFEVGNLSHSIDDSYGPGESVRGWINISLEDENSNSVFESGSGDSISLIDLLETDSSFDYDCNPLNCDSDYSATSGENSKIFNLNQGESAIVGIKFTGSVNSINSIKFDAQSNAGVSCYNQLKIDFGNDGEINTGNTKLSTGVCSTSKDYGCFNESKTTEEYTLSSIPYCQKIRLSESPGFRLGAWVKKTSGSGNVTLALYDNGDEIENANCYLPDASLSWGEISCDIEHLVTEAEDYYVCIYSNGGVYKIKGYSDSDGCGFYGNPVRSEIASYKIFAEGKKFGSVGTLNINNSLPKGNTLNGLFLDYLTETYGNGIDCSSECIVPIKFISRKDQSITLSNLQVNYEKTSGQVTENKFYNLNEIPAVISSEFQKLEIDEGNFSVASDYGNSTFLLKLNDIEIFSEDIIVERVPIIQSLSPTTTVAAFPTNFYVSINSSNNISSYQWEFGNGDVETTTKNRVAYTYNSTNSYKLKITVTDKNQLSSYKIFDVIVGSPKEVINTTLKKKLDYLDNIKIQISEFPVFYQEGLNSILDTAGLNEQLKEIQKAYVGATSESEYTTIMRDLIEINVPKSIAASKSAEGISFYPERENINLDVLKSFGGGSYDASNEDEYIDAILAWYQENIEIKIDFDELSAQYEYNEEPLLNMFELNIKNKNSLSNLYIILEELEGINFKESYSEEKESGYINIDLDDSSKTIIFSATEDVSFVDLPLFVSPGISKFSITEPFNGEPTSKWTFFILIILLLLILGIVAYIILQTWYKRKYEDFLFKNKNNLYNMVTYVNNSKRKGLKNSEISRNLKKAKWNSEQVRYVMRKYSGKRTGMFELPITKILRKLKKKKIEKRDQGYFAPGVRKRNLRRW